MTVEYRLHVDDEPAPRDLARAIDEIVVSQLVGGPWEAQLTIPVCLDAQGRWDAEAQRFLTARTRFRIEVRAGGAWVPLLDGPTSGADVAFSGDPNGSAVTVIVRDDTSELARDRTPRRAEDGDTYRDFVRTLLENREHLPDLELDVPAEAPPEGHAPHQPIVPAGTSVYDYLTDLAEQLGRYFYVLPGAQPGRSLGVFAPLPRPGDAREPELILAGPSRNVEALQLDTTTTRPGRVTVRHVDVRERAVRTTTRTMRDTELLGDAPASDDDVEVLVPGGAAAAAGPETAAEAALARAGYTIRGTGAVEGRCYGGVLRPFRYVDVRGVSTRLTGTYLVWAVTHTLSRAGYRQEFTLRRNATAEAAP